jgi:hypothetical protein
MHNTNARQQVIYMRNKSTVMKVTYPLSLAFLLMSVAWGAHADTMSSTNYMIWSDAVSIGGNKSSSTNFSAQDTIGESLSGENLASANYSACVGYQCRSTAPFVRFEVSTGIARPGTPGGSVNLGRLHPATISGSNGDDINSIFVDAETNSPTGGIVSVYDAHAGLASQATPSDVINSQSINLTTGTSGYGLCVSSVTEAGSSPATMEKSSPFDGLCNFTIGHVVGGLTTSPQTIVQTGGALEDGQADILVKAARSATQEAHADYMDQVTFIFTATF